MDRKTLQDFIEDKIGKSIKLLAGGNQDRFQQQALSLAEITSMVKSNVGLLREVRNALGEYSEEHKANLQVVQASQAQVESTAEQVAEMTEQIQRMKDMLEAQTERLQGQREQLQRLSPPYRPPQAASSSRSHINLEEALRHGSSPPIYFAADQTAPQKRLDADVSHVLRQVSDLLQVLRYN